MTTVTYYCLSVCIETTDHKLLTLIRSFLDKYYTSKQMMYSKAGQMETKLFASKIKNCPVYYMHTNQFIHLYHYLKEIGHELKADEKIDKRVYDIETVDYKVREGWALREHQVPVYDFLLDNPTKSKLVPLQTGAGKTSTAMITIAAINHRLGIVILSRFCEKWVSDIVTIHETRPEEVMVVQGFKSLAGIIRMAKENVLTSKYIIFSAETIQSFISSYEEDPDICVDMYGCSPIDLFPLLKIGIMLNDETHMSFHLMFKIIIHTNVNFQIGLSATLMSEDAVIKRVHSIVYPALCVYAGSKIEKYMDLYPVAYSATSDAVKRLKTSNYGSNNYSHTAFEQSILKQPSLFTSYVDIVNTAIEDYYVEDFMEGDKIAIFVALVETANLLMDILKEKYPDKKVVRYCEKDSYDDMLTGDIIVSTPLSLAVGIDIPHLRVGIMTVSIASAVTNLQSSGRLRKLPDRDVKFIYIYCENIPKHVDYHHKRLEIFERFSKNIVLRKSRKVLDVKNNRYTPSSY